MGKRSTGVTRWSEIVYRIVSSFLVRDRSFYVLSNSCGGAQSAEGACDPGGGGGNKFELLDITEE